MPAPGTGLSRTERLILERLEDEPATAGDLFAAVGAADEPRFLGDWPFFARLDRLAAPPRALVEGLPGPCPYGSLETMQAYARSTVRITATGRETMAGRLDWFAARQEARWLGGTRLEPSRPWRWEPATGTLSRG
jgi:hypothetical protein